MNEFQLVIRMWFRTLKDLHSDVVPDTQKLENDIASRLTTTK